MKICYVLDFSVFKVDGPTINEYEFVNHLINVKNLDIYFFISKENEKFHFKHKSRRVTFFNDYKSKRLIGIFWESVIIFFKFISFYKKVKPDIIVTRLGPVPILQLWLSIFFGDKLFLKTVSRFWKINNQISIKDKIFTKVLFYINLQILRRSRGLDTVTESFKSIFINRFGIRPENKIKVIENSVNIRTFFPANPSQKKWDSIILNDKFPILGYVGNLPSERGAKQLVKLYKMLKPQFPNICVIIAGEDRGLMPLKRQALEENLESIYYVGEIPYANVEGLINIFDIGYSFTTDYDLKEVGNCSQKVRQYLACGKPVITMLGTNDFIDVNDLGATVDQNDIDEISKRTIEWTHKILFQKEFYIKKTRSYAKQNLSFENSFKERIKFWRVTSEL